MIEVVEEQKNGIVYIDEKNGVKLQLPKGWDTRKHFNGMELFIYKEEEGQPLQSNVNFMILENKNHGRMEQILRRTKMDVRHSVQDFELYELTCMDKEHGRFVCGGNREKRKYTFWQEIYLVENSIYCFTACAPVDEKDRVQEELEQIMLSVQVG